MRNGTLLTLLVLLAATIVLEACPPTRRGGGDDDDDSASSDDDDTVADDDDDDDDTPPPSDDDDDDDDDDATPPPSDFAPQQVTFGALFEMFCVDEACLFDIEYEIRYWADESGGTLLCTQNIVGKGDGEQGFGTAIGWENATASFTVDNFQDVTNPVTDPDHCDMDDVNAANLNYGESFITAPPDGLGDFRAGVILNAGVHDALGTDYSDNGTLNFDDLQDTYAEFDLTYGGLIFWDANVADSSAAGLLDAGLFNGAGSGDRYQPTMIFYFSPETNGFADPNSDMGLAGEYGAGGTFLYNVQ